MFLPLKVKNFNWFVLSRFDLTFPILFTLLTTERGVKRLRVCDCKVLFFMSAFFIIELAVYAADV